MNKTIRHQRCITTIAFYFKNSVTVFLREIPRSLDWPKNCFGQEKLYIALETPNFT